MLTFKELIAHYGRGEAARKLPPGFVEFSASLWDGTCVAEDGDHFGRSERVYFYELPT